MYGALFGTAFPLLGTLIRVFLHEGNVDFGTVLHIHAQDPLLLIIDTAPIVLALFAFFLGKGRQRIESLLQDVHSQAASFERFYPRQFVTLLGKQSVRDVSAGAHVSREMTILFSDIRGYTSMSESLDSRELFEIMRDYFEWVSPIFLQHGGFIDKYIGDSIMAIFPGTPGDAVRAAGDLMRHLRSYNEMAGEMGRPAIQVGVGIHTGPLSIGTLGAGNRLSTTVMGDVVNLASRIEGLTRKFHVPVIITDTVYKSLSEAEQDDSREIAVARVKGRARRITLFEYFAGELEQTRERKKATRADFLRALYLHRGGVHEEASAIFQQIHITSPQDPVPVLYIELCKRHARETTLQVAVRKLLVIDDNPAIVDLIRAFLRGRPFKVFAAETGQSAQELFQREKPDIVFVDFYLPDTDGISLLKSLNAVEGAAARMIAMTADEELDQEFLAAGALGLLHKPLTKRTLFQALEVHE